MPDKKYKCLNPVGIREEVETFPLAPRLDTLDGKKSTSASPVSRTSRSLLRTN